MPASTVERDNSMRAKNAWALISARWRFIAAMFTLGSTRAAPIPRAGQTAPKDRRRRIADHAVRAGGCRVRPRHRSGCPAGRRALPELDRLVPCVLGDDGAGERDKVFYAPAGPRDPAWAR